MARLTAGPLRRTIHPIRRGFTLAEIMVVMAIISVLAAVLVPSVVNQMTRSQVSRAVRDLTSIRTAMESFIANVHRYPGDIEDLGTPITAADRNLDGTAYSPGLAARWDGPYLEQVMEDGGTLDTGFGGQVLDSLAIVAYGNGVDYATVLVVGIGQNDFYEIDRVVDGDTASAGGRLRWVTGDTVRYLALPKN